MQSLVSVVIPVYNMIDYLEECLDSVVAQTYKSLEIILINDGSTDGSSEICVAYAAKDQRIKLICKENEGVARARKTGIEVAGASCIVKTVEIEKRKYLNVK